MFLEFLKIERHFERMNLAGRVKEEGYEISMKIKKIAMNFFV